MVQGVDAAGLAVNPALVVHEGVVGLEPQHKGSFVVQLLHDVFLVRVEVATADVVDVLRAVPQLLLRTRGRDRLALRTVAPSALRSALLVCGRQAKQPRPLTKQVAV
ncbi:unnamed protein product, partial [Amoebophrya sp. A120]|eukprot:GSA120T00006374001.1